MIENDMELKRTIPYMIKAYYKGIILSRIKYIFLNMTSKNFFKN